MSALGGALLGRRNSKPRNGRARNKCPARTKSTTQIVGAVRHPPAFADKSARSHAFEIVHSRTTRRLRDPDDCGSFLDRQSCRSAAEFHENAPPVCGIELHKIGSSDWWSASASTPLGSSLATPSPPRVTCSHVAAALVGASRPRMIDENASHHAGGDAEEVCPVAPLDTPLINQPYVCLVDERGREAASGRPAHAPSSPPPRGAGHRRRAGTRRWRASCRPSLHATSSCA